jgi:hypothetical protein
MLRRSARVDAACEWGATRLAGLDRFSHTAWLLVAALIGASWAFTYAAGGTSSGLPHLFYLPVFIAAFIYGLPGGIVTGVVAGAVCAAWLPVSVEGDLHQDTRTWLIRVIAFVVAGAVVGAFSSSLRGRVQTLEQMGSQVVSAFVRAIDAMHPTTARHSEKVAEYCVETARELGLSRAQQESVRMSALLHDVGKLGLPTTILDKPGELSETEWELVRRHPVESEKILAGVQSFFPYLPGVRHHHERRDGAGYPDGLAGNDIPLAARIIAVGDAFDAMTSSRSYRAAFSDEKALAVLQAAAGSQFDPEVVAAFVAAHRRVEATETAPPPRPRARRFLPLPR